MSGNQALIDALERVRQDAPRRREALEAPERLTQLHVDFLVAYGFAELGQPNRAAEVAPKFTTTSDPAHAWLRDMFALRIEQARTRAPVGNPHELRTSFAQLDSGHAFKVSRLREVSEILEPLSSRLPACIERGSRSRGRERRGVQRSYVHGSADHRSARSHVSRKAVRCGCRPTRPRNWP